MLGVRKGDRELKVRVEGQLVLNSTTQMLNAALAGLGLAYVPQDLAQPHLDKGLLSRVLEDWCPPYSGYHPLLPEPAPVLTGVCTAGRCAALPGLTLPRRLTTRRSWRGIRTHDDHKDRITKLFIPSQRGEIARDGVAFALGQHLHEFRHVELLVRSSVAKARIAATRYSY